MTRTAAVVLDGLDDLLGRYQGGAVPGLAVGVYVAGELARTATVGLASLEHCVPVVPKTIFDLASVSKQFTATCVLLLERDGKLTLDDDLRDHLSGLRLRARVSLRQCAHHTAGLREYMALNALVGAGPETWRTEAAVVRVLAAQYDTDFEPGTQWSYSNTGYIALAAVVRAVTGQSLGEFARGRLFTPLGMDATHFQEDAATVVRNKASGYVHDDESGSYRRADSLDDIVGDGGLLTNVVDLARWDGFLTDGSVLGADLRDRLIERAMLADGRVIPYALGIEHEQVCGRPAVGHGGNIEGYHAHLVHLLDDGIGVAVLTNRNDVDPRRVVRDVARVVLGLDAAARPIATGVVFDDPVGLWHAPIEDTFLAMTLDDNNRLLVDFGPATIPFVRADDGWRPERLAVDVVITVAGDCLVLNVGEDDWNPVAYNRTRAADVPVDSALVATFASVELGALARVTIAANGDGLLLQTGAQGPVPLRAVQPDLYRTAQTTVRIERIDGVAAALVMSGNRIRRVRFERTDSTDGTDGPVGFPLCLGGPRPDDVDH